MQSVAAQNREAIIDRIAQGQKLTDIARSFGLSTHSAISNILADDPEYLKAREVGAHARMEARECELEASDDSVTVARARELLSHARWRAEREFPHRWGNKQLIEHTGTVTIEHSLKTDARSLVSKFRKGASAGATIECEDAKLIENQEVTP